ncbi:Uncharacterized protein GBIM_08534, partial [Gryllus bimaculatus]
KIFKNSLKNYYFGYNLFPIPSTPSESSFENKVYESPDTKTLELEKQLKALEDQEKIHLNTKITHLGPKLTEYLNHANGHTFRLRPVGKYKYIGDAKVQFHNDTRKNMKVIIIVVLILKTILERGDKSINPLDKACKYDIAYRDHKDLESRHQADKILQNETKIQIFSKDADLKGRMFNTAFSGIMFAKTKLGVKPQDSSWAPGYQLSFHNIL